MIFLPAAPRAMKITYVNSNNGLIIQRCSGIDGQCLRSIQLNVIGAIDCLEYMSLPTIIRSVSAQTSGYC